MTQLELDIEALGKKQISHGLTGEEKAKLSALQEEWIEIESAQHGDCLSCHM